VCACVQVVTANLPAGTMLALSLTALTAANPFSAFAVTLEPVALMLQRRLWSRPHAVSQQQQHEQQQQPTAVSSSSSSSSAGAEGQEGSQKQVAGGSPASQPPYALRAAIRLGETCALGTHINSQYA
jgi:hypothetical protein